MESRPGKAIRSGLVELFNSVIAGRLASEAFSDALCHEWLPAMALWVEGGGSEARQQATQVRRLLVRLGWLLEHLPRAASIHADLLSRALREYRSEFDALAPALFPQAAIRMRHVDLLDRELLDCLEIDRGTHGYRPKVARLPIVPIVGLRETPSQVHPHDREVSGIWKVVLLESRDRRRDEHEAIDALSRLCRLRAGDRVQVLQADGRRETWRVLRNVDASQNVLFENESTRRQGVMGVRQLASQFDAGRVAILG